MTATVSYEVHVMRGGRWATAGVYQDKDDALRDARGALRRRYIGIRVVEELYDPERDRYATRTIYRDQPNTGAGTAPGREEGSVPPMTAARASVDTAELAERLGRNLAAIDQPFRMAAMVLIGLSSAMLAGIFGLFWFGLV